MYKWLNAGTKRAKWRAARRPPSVEEDIGRQVKFNFASFHRASEGRGDGRVERPLCVMLAEAIWVRPTLDRECRLLWFASMSASALAP